MRVVISIFIILLTVYVVLGIYLYINQRGLLYFPQPYEQSQYHSMTVNQADASLDIIRLSTKSAATNEVSAGTPKQEKPAIIYFGGNAEAVMNSAALFEPLKVRYDIYLVNYRGYGDSTGNITEENNYADALAVYAEVAKQHASISVVGRSLGSGIATYLAEKKPVNKLVLITPYDSIKAVAQEKFPIYPMSLLLKDTYPSIKRAGGLSANTLILAAENDQVVPAVHAAKLAKAFSKAPTYAEIELANHADIMTDKTALKRFYQHFE